MYAVAKRVEEATITLMGIREHLKGKKEENQERPECVQHRPPTFSPVILML